ncbi:MAG: hypothetical protein ABFC80_09625 [Coriobacteriales bacterium]|nr:hypothetical protein [Actinomycetes bacterium]
MNGHMKKTAAIIALALVAALALPTIAVALPRANRAVSAVSTATAETVAANLRNRIENVLRARKARFDAAVANLIKRQDRVEALAGKVEALGGDVAGVRARLEESRRLLGQARAQEEVCAAAFRAVPDATDRRGAFRDARAKGREAVELLRQSRTVLRRAAEELGDVAERLREGEGQ